MKKFAPINVIVNYPTTNAGWRELQSRIAHAHAEGVINSILRLNCFTSDKERILKKIINDINEEIRHNN